MTAAHFDPGQSPFLGRPPLDTSGATGCIWPMRLVLLLSILWFANPALADDTARCVQNQLLAAGFNPGPVDGIVGGKTRRALATFQKQQAQVSTRRLTGETARIYCRLLGLARPELSAHWPSRASTHDFVFSDRIDTTFANAIRAEVEGARRTIRRELSVDFAHRPLIITAERPSDILRLLRIHRGQGYQAARDKLVEICGSEIKIGGLSFPGIVVICRAPGAAIQTEIARIDLRRVILHEYIHLLQTEFSGGTNSSMSDTTILKETGPIWLKEGSAEVVSVLLAYRIEARSYQMQALAILDADSVDLAGLEKRSALRRHELAIYLGGGAAAAEAMQRNGLAAFGQFYDLLGRGAAWPTAFDAAFGISREDLYACKRWAQRVYFGNCANSADAQGQARPD